MRDSVARSSTQDAILDATDILLGKYGYKKMTIDDLAREVGIGKGTIYLHFVSKEEIALSHIDRIVERLKGRLETIISSPATAAERLRRMMVERVTFRFDSVQHYTRSLNELLSQLRAKLLERRTRHFAEEAHLFVRVIEEGIKCGEFRKRPPASETARTLILATNSLLPYNLSPAELGERAAIKARTEAIAEMLITGLNRRDDQRIDEGVKKK
ncbi:MAG: TetR/AcrR family transcriptional regulator [Pyrinomonadaceae bacterium]